VIPEFIFYNAFNFDAFLGKLHLSNLMRYYKENIGVFRLNGKDVTDFLQRVSTNDIKKLSDKNTLRTVLLNDKGKIVDFVTLLKYEDVFMLIASAGNELKVKDFFAKYVITDDVELSLEYKDKITMVPEFENDYEGLTGCNFAEGNYMYFDDFRFKKIIVIESNPDSDLLKVMKEKCGLFSDEVFRNEAIEKFYVYDSNELNENINPLECHLKDFISFEKGCYIGQEVISRLDSQYKIPKEMVKIHSNSELKPGDKVYYLTDGVQKECGFITSTGRSRYDFTALGFIRGIDLKEEYNYYINNNADSIIMINKFK